MKASQQYHLLHAGFTRYHHVALIVPLLAALSPMLLARLVPVGRTHDAPSVGRALTFGAIVGLASYALLKFAPLLREPHAEAKSALLGLLVAEFALMTTSHDVPSVVALSLFAFLYFFSISKLDS